VSAVARATKAHSPREFAFCQLVAGITYAVTKEAVKEHVKEDAAQSVKPQHVETVKKKTGSKPKIAALSTQAAKQVFSLPAPCALGTQTPRLLPLEGLTLGACVRSTSKTQTWSGAQDDDEWAAAFQGDEPAEPPPPKDPNEWTAEQQVPRAFGKASTFIHALAALIHLLRTSTLMCSTNTHTHQTHTHTQHLGTHKHRGHWRRRWPS
jgi:hypothetical protein